MRNLINTLERISSGLKKVISTRNYLSTAIVAGTLASAGCGNSFYFFPITVDNDHTLNGPTLTMETSEQQASEPLCSDSCEYALNGECDDGGPDSLYSKCDLGTDCSDCGPR